MIESPAVRVGMNDSDRVCICSSSRVVVARVCGGALKKEKERRRERVIIMMSLQKLPKKSFKFFKKLIS